MAKVCRGTRVMEPGFEQRTGYSDVPPPEILYGFLSFFEMMFATKIILLFDMKIT